MKQRWLLIAAVLAAVVGIGSHWPTPAEKYPVLPVVSTTGEPEVTAPARTQPSYVDRHQTGGVAELARSFEKQATATPTTGAP